MKKVVALGSFMVSVSVVTGFALYTRMRKLKENEEIIE